MTRKDLTALAQSAVAAMPGLSSEEQRAGIVLLRELAKGEPVAVPQFAQALGVSVSEAEALVKDSGLSRLIYAGEDGRVVGFWGLSTARTHHKFTINGRTLWAWCAGDTLFLPGGPRTDRRSRVAGPRERRARPAQDLARPRRGGGAEGRRGVLLVGGQGGSRA